MNDIKIIQNDHVPLGTMYWISPRKRVIRRDATGKLREEWEPLMEWAKRCAVIKNLKVDTKP